MANLPTIASRYQLQRGSDAAEPGGLRRQAPAPVRKLAMKVLLSHAANQPDLVQRFRREMQALSAGAERACRALPTPILRRSCKGFRFWSWSFCPGADLGRLVVERGACPAEEVLWLLGRARRTRSGARRRDCPPRLEAGEYVPAISWTTSGSSSKLLDFGVARMIGRPDSQ